MRSVMYRLLASMVLCTSAGFAVAQQDVGPRVSGTASVQVVPTILTVDIDRLFAQSQFGERIAQNYTEEGTALLAENQRIAAALREEELVLAQQRPEMDPAVFRIEAAAFDEKAQAIRRAQDAKETALDNMLSEGRTQFLEVTRPILGQLMADRGAVAMLERRSVLLALGSIDVTDEAIVRIDDAIGDGVDEVPDPEQTPLPTPDPEN